MFLIDTSILMKANLIALVNQNELQSVEEKIRAFPMHIYMICERPRISLKDGKMNITPYNISGHIIIHGQENNEVPFNARNTRGYEAIICDYPFNKIHHYSCDGRPRGFSRVSIMVPELVGYQGFLDLNILYIGQAFGEDGSRVAPDRLLSHKTCQQIYSHALDNKPHSEIMFVMASFVKNVSSSIPPETERPIPDGNFGNEFNLMKNTHDPKIIGEQEQITLTEAAMIKYFKPFYNTEYKNIFPSEKHSSYKSVYDLNLHSVGFEIETSILNAKIFSDYTSRSSFHAHLFMLDNERERNDFFEAYNAYRI